MNWGFKTRYEILANWANRRDRDGLAASTAPSRTEEVTQSEAVASGLRVFP